jgi:drug/metabolite transporter (DMT)-like permease
MGEGTLSAHWMRLAADPVTGRGARYAALAVAVLAISLSAIFIRWATAPPLAIATYRMLFATLLLAPAVALVGHGELSRLERTDWARLGLAGVFLAAHFGLWTVSLGLTSVASSVVFVSAHPLLVAAGERWWLRAPPSGGVAAGVVLGLVGTILLGAQDLRGADTALLGDGLAFGGAIALAGYLLIGRRLRPHLGFVAYSFAVYLSCALALMAVALLLGTDLGAATPTDFAIFLALAVVCTLGGHTVFNWALRHLPAAVVALAFVGEPAVAAILAWALLGEALPAPTAIGGALILAGVYLAARRG